MLEFNFFITACESGNIAYVNQALENETISANAALLNNSALYAAAFHGHLQVVNRLLELENVRASVTADDNAVFRGAASNGQYDVVTRLLQEKNVTDYLKQQRLNSTEEPQAFFNEAEKRRFSQHKDFFKEIEDKRLARFVAAQCLNLNYVDQNAVGELPSNEHHGDAIHTRPIENQILTYLYHDVLCGKSACLERKKEDSFFKCLVIGRFRDDAVQAKARAQAKLGTQATTSTSTNSSTEPSKKARTS